MWSPVSIYNEYVSIESNKKYLMMIGEGINQTVITGNRSVVDGWTTFNSATFSKPTIILSFFLKNKPNLILIMR